MSDRSKFLISIVLSGALVAMILAQNLGAGSVLSRVGDEWRRRRHYENVIAPKGLDLRKGMYWKEKE